MRGAALWLVLVLVLTACGSEEEAAAPVKTGPEKTPTEGTAEQKPDEGPGTTDLRETEVDRDPLAGLEIKVASGDPDVREVAAGKLGEVEPELRDRAAALLVRLLTDEVEEVRMVAAGSLINLKVEDIGPLRDRLRAEEEPIVRQEFLRAIYELAGAEAESDLLMVAANEDEEENLRTFAIDALGRIAARSAREYLEEASEDISPKIRLAAVKSLGKIGTEGSLEVLGERMSDTDVLVRIEAARALKTQRGRKVVRYLMVGMDTDDPDLLKEVNAGLEAITKQKMGYDPMKGVEENAKAIEGWKAWWVKNEKYY